MFDCIGAPRWNGRLFSQKNWSCNNSALTGKVDKEAPSDHSSTTQCDTVRRVSTDRLFKDLIELKNYPVYRADLALTDIFLIPNVSSTDIRWQQNSLMP